MTEHETTALHPLITQRGHKPDGIVRYRGALYVRYGVEFWRIVDGRLEPYSGMFPNEAIHEGAVNVE